MTLRLNPQARSRPTYGVTRKGRPPDAYLRDRLVAAKAFVGPFLSYVPMDGLLARVFRLPADEPFSHSVNLFLQV